MPRMMRRRPIARAAMVGGTAYVAGRAGAKAGARQANEEQQQYAPEEQYAPEPQYAPAPAEPEPSTEDKMAQLQQLKGLLDAGALTQAEFDAQKTKILSTM